jgi:hypothetical protein
MSITHALVPSTILTLIVSAAVGAAGSTGTFLHVQSADVIGYVFYWSWSFFFAAMTLNSCIVLQAAKSQGPAASAGSMSFEEEAELGDWLDRRIIG